MFRRFLDWLAFTRTEQRVILFLSGTLVVGAGIRLYQEASPSQRHFDYRSLDSSFAEFRERVARDTVQHKSGRSVKSIDVNSASKEDLMSLPGIGPVLAQRILEYRDNQGGFESVDELQNVKGISKKKLEKLRPLVIVE